LDAKEGKPFCSLGKKFLRGCILPQCKSCRHIIYIGCPAFEPGRIALSSAKEYIEWLIPRLS